MGVMQRARRLAGGVRRRLRGQSWPGYCAICERRTRFTAYGSWYRDQLLCGHCHSIPRERALMRVIATLYPGWRSLSIHESSPGRRGVSVKMEAECPGYVASHYLPAVPPGARDAAGRRCEDIERQTFADESFDLVVSQDVFEHLFEPDRAIAEIARTLRPGGAHIMTVPIVNGADPSRRRASRTATGIVHHAEPDYHSNPVDPAGSLVTIDWGYDIADYLAVHSGLPTSIHSIDDPAQGIRAAYIEVVASRKGVVPDLAPAPTGAG